MQSHKTTTTTTIIIIIIIIIQFFICMLPLDNRNVIFVKALRLKCINLKNKAFSNPICNERWCNYHSVISLFMLDLIIISSQWRLLLNAIVYIIYAMRVIVLIITINIKHKVSALVLSGLFQVYFLKTVTFKEFRAKPFTVPIPVSMSWNISN